MFAQLHSCFLIFYIYSVNNFSVVFFSPSFKSPSQLLLAGLRLNEIHFQDNSTKNNNNNKNSFFFFFRGHTRIASAEDYLNN